MNTKKIGIDARLYSQTGVGVYIKNLLFYLQDLVSSQLKVIVYIIKQDKETILFRNKNFVTKIVEARWHSLEEQISFFRVLQQDKCNLVHFPYFSYPVLYKQPYISTVHDLTPVFYKTGKASTRNPLYFQLKHFFFKRVLSSQIKNASYVITPTNTVKKQLTTYFGSQYENKIVSIYEGVNIYLMQAKENKELKNKFRKDFFIYVGNFYPHKNIEALIRSFSLVKTNVQLILLGPDDYFTEQIRISIRLQKAEKKIMLFPNPTLSDLVFFYKHAKGLIHPTLSEGFGLPLVEAMYFNLPILASDIEVFHEILGDDYMFFNPHKIESITKTISNFLDKNLFYDYSSRLIKYSYKDMTNKTYEIYNKIIYGKT